MGDETDPDGTDDSTERQDASAPSGEAPDEEADAPDEEPDAPDEEPDVPDAGTDVPDAGTDVPEEAGDAAASGDAGDDAPEDPEDAPAAPDDAGGAPEDDGDGTSGDVGDDRGSDDGGDSGLSTPDPDDLADPGQDPEESVRAPPDADDGSASADEEPAGDETAGGSAGPDDPPAVTGTPPDDDGDPLPDDPLDETGAAGTEAPGEADGGVVAGEEGIVPADEPEQTGDLWEDARPSEPPDDEEMPLADHIEEMIRRLAVVVAVAGTVSIVLFPLAEVPIDFLWNSILPSGGETDPRVYAPLELMFTRLKVASLAGLVVALPVFVYETYQFMRPGLYPHERRYYLAAVPTSLVLALVGIGFAYFFVLPAIFIYFLEYTKGAALVAFSLKKTFDLILILMGYLAIVFQIPLFIMLAIMMGLTTREWLARRRIYFWGGFLGVSFIFGVDPTGMAPIIVAATMVVLFEGTLLLLKWTGRG